MRLLPVLALLALASGCAAEPAPEEQGATTSKFTGCEVLSAAAGATAAVAVISAQGTGTCASTAVAATVVTGGAAAAGSLVCLVPAGGTLLASLASIVAARTTYLVYGAVEFRIEAADAPAEESASSGERRTCSDDDHRALARAKGAACDDLPRSCSDLVRSRGGGSKMCIGLDGRRGEFQKCTDARQEVIDRCFGGTATDAGHAQQLADMGRLIADCERILDQACGGLVVGGF